MRNYLIITSLFFSTFIFGQTGINIRFIDKTTNEGVYGAQIGIGAIMNKTTGPEGEINFRYDHFISDSITVLHPNYCFDKTYLRDLVGTIDQSGRVNYVVYGYPCYKQVSTDISLSRTNKVDDDFIFLHCYDFSGSYELKYIPNHKPNEPLTFSNDDKNKRLKININDLRNGLLIKTANNQPDTIQFNKSDWKNPIILEKELLNTNDKNLANSSNNYIELNNKRIIDRRKERRKFYNKIDSLEVALEKCKGHEMVPPPPPPIEEEPIYFLIKEQCTPSKTIEQIAEIVKDKIGYKGVKKQGVLQFLVEPMPGNRARVRLMGDYSEDHEGVYRFIKHELQSLTWKFDSPSPGRIKHKIVYTFTIVPQ